LPTDVQAFYSFDVYNTEEWVFEHERLVEPVILPEGPLTADKIAHLLLSQENLAPNLQFVWIGRKFIDDYGTCEQEGAWIRENGKVFYKCDVGAVAYEHDPLDWIWKESAAGIYARDGVYNLVWSELATRGSYVAVGFTLTRRDIVMPVPRTLSVNVARVPIGVFTLPAFSMFPKLLRPMLGTALIRIVNYWPGVACVLKSCQRYVPITQALYQKVRKEFAVAPKNAITLRRVGDTIANYQDQDKDYRLLKTCFPHYFPEENFGVALSLLNNNLSADLDIITQIVDQQGRDMREFNRLLSSDMFGQFKEKEKEDVPINYWKWGSVALLGFVGCYVLKKNVKTGYLDVLLTPLLEDLLKLIGIDRVASFLGLAPNYVSYWLMSCVVAPMYEEAIKRIPYVGWTFGWVEFFCRLPYNSVVGILPALLMHQMALKLPYWQAVSFHMLFNMMVMQVNHGSVALSEVRALKTACEPTIAVPYAVFYKKFYLQPWSERVLEDSPIRVTRFPEKLSQTPRSSEAYYDRKPSRKHLLKVKGKWTESVRNQTWFYWILPTSVPGYVAASTDKMLMDAVEARILVDPPLAPEEQKLNWFEMETQFNLLRYFEKFRFSKINWDDEIQSWLDHFDGPKKRRYKAKFLELASHGERSFSAKAHKTAVFVKSNELLFKIEKGMMKLKPRVIMNVAPEVQILVGPSIYAAQMRLKEIWNAEPEPFKIFGFVFYYTYAGASTDVDLSHWRQIVDSRREDCVSIIVSGDDSVVVVRYKGLTSCYEGDASMYDQSQSFGPLAFERKVLKAFGVDDSVLLLLKTLSENDYLLLNRNRDSRILIDKMNRALRDTGGSNTSFGNGVVMVFGWTAVMLRCKTYEDFNVSQFEKEFLFLGFDMKIKVVALEQPTFLKGMWYDTRAGPFWAPLISRILKFGKSVSDPRIIYKVKDLHLASRYFLHDLACGLDTFVQVPILRQLVKNYKIPDRKMILQGVYDWKVKGTNTKPKLLKSSFINLEQRYGFSEREIVAVEQMLPKDCFYFLEHPLFVRMALVDYN